MQNLDLNTIYLKSDKKAIALFNNVVSDKSGNIYINPALIPESNENYVKTHLDNLIEKITSLSAEFNEKGIIDYNEELQILMNMSLNMLSSLSSDDEINDEDIESIISAFDELSNMFSDELPEQENSFGSTKKLEKRGDSEELKNLKLKVDAAISYSEEIHGKIDKIAKNIASVDETLTKREKNKDYIFPNDEDTLGAEIIKIKNNLLNVKKEVDEIKTSDPLTYNIMDRTDPESLIYDKEASIGEKIFDNIGSIALGIVVLWLFIPYVLLSLFWERDKSSHDDTYNEFLEFLQNLPGEPFLDTAFKTYFNLIRGLEAKYNALKKNYTVVSYCLDPEWIEPGEKNIVNEAKCYKYIEGDIEGNEGEVYKFYEWNEPHYLNNTYFLGIFGTKSNYTVPEPPAAPEVKAKFSTRIKYTLIKSGGDSPGAFDEVFGPWDKPAGESNYGDPQPCESGSNLYKKLENKAPEGYRLDRIELDETYSDELHYNVIYVKKDDSGGGNDGSIKLEVSYAMNSTVPSATVSKLKNCYKIQYSSTKNEHPIFSKHSLNASEDITAFCDALTSIFSKDDIDAACNTGSIYSEPTTQDGKTYSYTRTHYALESCHTDVCTTYLRGEARFYYDEDDINNPSAAPDIVRTVDITGTKTIVHISGTDTIISSKIDENESGDSSSIIAPEIPEDLKQVKIDDVVVLDKACWEDQSGNKIDPGAKIDIPFIDVGSGQWTNSDYCGVFGPSSGGGQLKPVPITKFFLTYKSKAE